jgi:hypothetical protein
MNMDDDDDYDDESYDPDEMDEGDICDLYESKLDKVDELIFMRDSMQKL